MPVCVQAAQTQSLRLLKATIGCGAEFLHSFHYLLPASPALAYCLQHLRISSPSTPTSTAYIKRLSRPVDDAIFYTCRTTDCSSHPHTPHLDMSTITPEGKLQPSQTPSASLHTPDACACLRDGIYRAPEPAYKSLKPEISTYHVAHACAAAAVVDFHVAGKLLADELN